MASRTYLQLIRENRDFRRLWIAAVISMLGEWVQHHRSLFPHIGIHWQRIPAWFVVYRANGRLRHLTAVYWTHGRPIQSENVDGRVKPHAGGLCPLFPLGQ